MFEHQSQDFQIKCRQKNTTFRPEYTVENLPVGFLGPPALLRRYDFRGHVSCILVKGNSPFSLFHILITDVYHPSTNTVLYLSFPKSVRRRAIGTYFINTQCARIFSKSPSRVYRSKISKKIPRAAPFLNDFYLIITFLSRPYVFGSIPRWNTNKFF